MVYGGKTYGLRGKNLWFTKGKAMFFPGKDIFGIGTHIYKDIGVKKNPHTYSKNLGY